VRWFVLLFIITAKVSNAGTYFFQQGGSWGPTSGISVNLNQFYDVGTNPDLGVTGIGKGPGVVRFTTDSDSVFSLNSQGNGFYIANYLLISNLSDSLGFVATVANSAIRLGQSIYFGNVSIYENIAPLVWYEKFDISTGTEVTIVDNYRVDMETVPNRSFLIKTRNAVYEPQNMFFKDIVLNLQLLGANTDPDISYTAGFQIEDSNGNPLSYLSVIPEPSAVSLLAVGLGGLAMMRRRRS
jgi:hypothetical protein